MDRPVEKNLGDRSGLRRAVLVFEKCAAVANLRLMSAGSGQDELDVPPITVPAWSCMMASKDPGTLGIYAFATAKITATAD